MSGLLPYFVNALLYALLGFHFWRTRWRTAAAGAKPRPEKIQPWERAAILLPLLLHGTLLYHSLLPSEGLNLGVGNVVSVVVWLTVLIYWLANFWCKLEGLQAFVLGIAALSTLFPLMLPGTHSLSYSEPPAFMAHLLMALLAYSLFTIAAVHAGLMLLVERRLHSGTLPALLQNLPPLLTMESLLFRVISVGFILLTLTLASGALFSEELFNKPLQFTHKTVFAIVSWVIFGALLAGRSIYGWRGRTAIRWTLAGFAMLLLAYVGSKFVLEVILHK
jgi:ABC-type uncharacterized transport system permease subunit